MLRKRSGAERYGIALGIVILALALRWLLVPLIGVGTLYITLFPAMVLVAVVLGAGPALLGNVLGIVAIEFHQIVPQGASPLTLSLVVRSGIMLATTAYAGYIGVQLRAAKERAERETAVASAANEALRRQVELIDGARAALIAEEMRRVVAERVAAAPAVPPAAPDVIARLPVVAGGIVAAVGLLGLVGWWLDIAALKSVLPGLAMLKANTALCFLCLGVALLLRRRLRLRVALSTSVAVVAWLTMVEYLAGVDLGIDELLFRDTGTAANGFPGRMAEATALGLLMNGLALALPDRRAGRWAALALAGGAGLIGLLALLGYLYGVSDLYGTAGFGSVALQTAISLVLAAVGITIDRLRFAPAAQSRLAPAAHLIRTLMPLAVLAPLLIGGLVRWGLHLGIYGEAMGRAVLTLATMLTLAALVGWSARALGRVDAVRRDAETQLCGQAEMMDAARDALIVRDRQGIIRYWNHGAELLYGWPAAEAVGQRCHALLHTAPAVVRAYDAALAETGHWTGELTHTTRDGRQVTVETLQTASRTSSGRALVLESHTDITERKVAEAQLVMARESAESANRAKSIFLATMSHEIRTPLHVIIGLTHLMRRGRSDPTERRRLHQLDANSEHLLALVNDILDLSKIEADQLALDVSDFSLEDVIVRVERVIGEAARDKDLALSFDVAPEVRALRLNGDPLRLTQVLINLASNAVKFTPQGSVSLAIRSPGQDPRGARLHFAVEDTGIGIAPAAQELLFQPFVQADNASTRRYGGSGLGLAICQRLVGLMGGKIEVESAVGKGSCFRFELTLPFGSAVAATPAAPEVAGSLMGRRILLAEDHPLSQDILVEMLDDLGCEVDVVSDGAEAVANAQEWDYDLILMDMQMPNMDGLAATRAIRALPRHRDTPIVALTANTYAEDRNRCLDAGMNGHIGKPVTPAKLAATLGQWLHDLPESVSDGDAPAIRDMELAEALSAIPQLDIDGMLRSYQGRLTELVGLLHRFADMHGADMARLRAHMTAGEHEEARTVAHNLKGIAGLLGARHVAAHASDIHAALRAGKSLVEIESSITACAADMADLLAAIHGLPVGVSASESSSVPKRAPALKR